MNEIDVAISQDLTAAIVRGEYFDPHFLAHALGQGVVQSAIGSLKRGATIKGIPRRDLLQVRFFAPSSLQEQHGIANFLRRLQDLAAVEARRAGLLSRLKAATLAKLFREGLHGEPLKQTEIGPMPASWRVATIAELSAKMDYGTSLRCGAKGDIPVLRIPNIADGAIDNADLKFANDVGNKFLSDGDILFVRTNGNRNYMGRCAAYAGAPKPAAFASYLIRLRLGTDGPCPD